MNTLKAEKRSMDDKAKKLRREGYVTGAVLCMAEQFGAFDRDNLIVPIWMI